MYTIGFVFILFYYLLSGLFFSFPGQVFRVAALHKRRGRLVQVLAVNVSLRNF